MKNFLDEGLKLSEGQKQSESEKNSLLESISESLTNILDSIFDILNRFGSHSKSNANSNGLPEAPGPSTSISEATSKADDTFEQKCIEHQGKYKVVNGKAKWTSTTESPPINFNLDLCLKDGAVPQYTNYALATLLNFISTSILVLIRIVCRVSSIPGCFQVLNVAFLALLGTLKENLNRKAIDKVIEWRTKMGLTDPNKPFDAITYFTEPRYNASLTDMCHYIIITMFILLQDIGNPQLISLLEGIGGNKYNIKGKYAPDMTSSIASGYANARYITLIPSAFIKIQNYINHFVIGLIAAISNNPSNLPQVIKTLVSNLLTLILNEFSFVFLGQIDATEDIANVQYGDDGSLETGINPWRVIYKYLHRRIITPATATATNPVKDADKVRGETVAELVPILSQYVLSFIQGFVNEIMKYAWRLRRLPTDVEIDCKVDPNDNYKATCTVKTAQTPQVPQAPHPHVYSMSDLNGKLGDNVRNRLINDFTRPIISTINQDDYDIFIEDPTAPGGFKKLTSDIINESNWKDIIFGDYKIIIQKHPALSPPVPPPPPPPPPKVIQLEYTPAIFNEINTVYGNPLFAPRIANNKQGGEPIRTNKDDIQENPNRYGLLLPYKPRFDTTIDFKKDTNLEWGFSQPPSVLNPPDFVPSDPLYAKFYTDNYAVPEFLERFVEATGINLDKSRLPILLDFNKGGNTRPSPTQPRPDWPQRDPDFDTIKDKYKKVCLPDPPPANIMRFICPSPYNSSTCKPSEFCIYVLKDDIESSKQLNKFKNKPGYSDTTYEDELCIAYFRSLGNDHTIRSDLLFSKGTGIGTSRQQYDKGIYNFIEWSIILGSSISHPSVEFSDDATGTHMKFNVISDDTDNYPKLNPLNNIDPYPKVSAGFGAKLWQGFRRVLNIK
jgi:hypothetical protein